MKHLGFGSAIFIKCSDFCFISLVDEICVLLSVWKERSDKFCLTPEMCFFIPQLAESYPIKRAAQLTAYLFHRGQDLGKGLDGAHTNSEADE